MSERQVLLKLLDVLMEWKGMDEKGKGSDKKQEGKGNLLPESKGTEGIDVVKVSNETLTKEGEKKKNGGVWASVARRATGRRAMQQREEERAKVVAEVKDRLLHRPTVFVYNGRKALNGVAIRELNEGFAKIFRSPLPMSVRLSGSHLLVTFSYKDEAIAAIRTMLHLAIKAGKSGGPVKGLPCPDCREQQERVVRDDVMRELLHMLRAYPHKFNEDMSIKEAFTMVCEHHPGAYGLLEPWLKSFSPDTSEFLTPRKQKNWDSVDVDAHIPTAAASGAGAAVAGFMGTGDLGEDFQEEDSWTNQEMTTPMRKLGQAIQSEEDEDTRIVMPLNMERFLRRRAPGYKPRTAAEQLEVMQLRAKQREFLQKKLKTYGGKSRRRARPRQRDTAYDPPSTPQRTGRTPSPITPKAVRKPTASANGEEGKPKVFALGLDHTPQLVLARALAQLKNSASSTAKGKESNEGTTTKPLDSAAGAGWGEGFWAEPPDNKDYPTSPSWDAGSDSGLHNLLRDDPNALNDWVLTEPISTDSSTPDPISPKPKDAEDTVMEGQSPGMAPKPSHTRPKRRTEVERLIQGTGMPIQELETRQQGRRKHVQPKVSTLGKQPGNVGPHNTVGDGGGSV